MFMMHFYVYEGFFKMPMSIWVFWFLGLFALLAWLLPAIDYSSCSWRPTRLDEIPVNPAVKLPRLSVVVAALNEEETLEQAMHTLLSLDYPDLEIIAVDDRSSDRTGDILDRLAGHSSRLRVVHVESLPSGWLGKNHALHLGSQQASGEYILFTDADVHFQPTALQRAVQYVMERNLDHLTLFPNLALEGFWEKLAVAFFGTMFSLYTRPWRVSDLKSQAYVGVGAFNLVRTSAYREMGGHTSLPMDVADDVKLGKCMKRNGGNADCLLSGPLVHVRWVVGIQGLINGLTKNMFAGFGFQASYAIAGALTIFVMAAWPIIGIFDGPMGARLLCAGAFAMMLGAADMATPAMLEFSPLYGLAFPFGALIFLYILFRSMFFTLHQGGIVWRGTFYPLQDLRKGVV
jgi:hypothetical protein